MRILTETINKYVDGARHAKLTPQQFRYVTKKVRERLNLKVPHRAQSLPNYMTPAELYVLADVAKDDALNSMLVEYQVRTGSRIFETRNQLIDNIDFKEHIIKIVGGKGNKDRFVPMTQSLEQKLLFYLSGRKSGYLFCKSNLTPYTIRALQYRIENLLKKCKFSKDLSTHSLRHTFACLCLARGLSIDKVRDLMGHSSVKVTEIYGKIMLPNLKDDFIKLMGGD